MIDPISTLMLMWMVANKGGAAAAPASSAAAKAAKARKGKSKAPRWPTAASPPPLPAFQALQTVPSADPPTSLADLHQSPPTPAPASAIDHAKQAATAAVRKKTTALIRSQALSLNPFAKKAPPPTSTALVASLQKILTNHGVKVAPDGLYGPKTASAWSTLAKRKGLLPAITREGPKIAKVVTQTFERLSVPPIP